MDLIQETNPYILNNLVNNLYQDILKTSDLYDGLACMELIGVMSTAILSVKLNKPFVIIRAFQKSHGTQRSLEGSASLISKAVLILNNKNIHEISFVHDQLAKHSISIVNTLYLSDVS